VKSLGFGYVNAPAALSSNLRFHFPLFSVYLGNLKKTVPLTVSAEVFHKFWKIWKTQLPLFNNLPFG
jgi:hypothetical protein